MRQRPFSKGRISKRIPPDFAVPQSFEVCALEPMGISHHLLKPQNIGAPPTHTVDTALRKGAWAQAAKAQFLYRRKHLITISRTEPNYTIPPLGMGFITTKHIRLARMSSPSYSSPLSDSFICNANLSAHSSLQKRYSFPSTTLLMDSLLGI